ncbi:MAG TPA: hypothetical protein VMZ53_09845 [Kofleriaceae bacterium]|nr:hypothetical protein [Kofleriaceae bacterium]
MDPGTLEVTVDYPAVAFFYFLMTPNIVIDGQLERRRWGTHAFEVAAGRHKVEVSYPWFLIRRAGKRAVVVDVLPGQTVRIHYRANVIRYVPGTISVDAQIPEARALE